MHAREENRPRRCATAHWVGARLGAALLGMLLLLVVAALGAAPARAAGAFASEDETSGWVRSDGTVWMWGQNGSGQLGQGTSGSANDSIVPKQVQVSAGVPLTGVSKLTVGGNRAIAIKSDGTAWAWGYGYCGTLFNGSTSNVTYATQMYQAAGTPITTAVDVATDYDQTWVVLSSGQLLTNKDTPSGSACTNYPITATTNGTTAINNAVKVVAEQGTTIVARSDGTAWSAYSNRLGKLGRGMTEAVSSTEYSFGPMLLPGGTPITGIVDASSGSFVSGLRRSDNTAWAAGNLGDAGAIGTSSDGYVYQVQTSAGVPLTGITHGDVGDQQLTVYRRTDGSVWGVGMYDFGQQGNSACCYALGQELTGYLAAFSGAKGTSHFLRNDGQLLGSGENHYGEAGTCHTRALGTPALVNTACAAPYSPWAPEYLTLKNAAGQSARIKNWNDYWVNSGVTDSAELEFQVRDQDATDVLTPRLEFQPSTTTINYFATCSTTGTALPTVATTSNVYATSSTTRTGLTHGGKYWWRVCAIDSGGRQSGWGYPYLWWPDRTDTVNVDVVNPTAPTSVLDGNPGDDDWTNSSSSLSATFAGGSDADSGIWGVQYCVTTSSSGADCTAGALKVWTSTQTTASWNMYSLSLVDGTTYYVCAKVEDYARNVSPGFACSDGIRVDRSAPTNPTPINDGTGADVDLLTSSTNLDANWPAGSDALSGVASYDYCFTTSSTGSNCSSGAQKTWTNTTGLIGSATGLALTHGSTYYTCIRTRDVAGNVSSASCSDGAVLDASAPTVALVSPANLATLVSTTTSLSATHTDADGDSGTLAFELCSDSACSSVVRSGSSAAVASGATGSWSVSPGLSVSTQYWWRARATDLLGRSSAWSAVRTFTTMDGPIVPNARGWGFASSDWWRDDKNGGSACPGGPVTIENEHLAIDEDIDSPVSTSCVGGAGQPEADFLQTGGNPAGATDRYELTDSPGSLRTVSAVALRTRGWMTGGKTTTLTAHLYGYDGALLGTSGPHTLSGTHTNFSTTFSGLTMYRTDIDGMYVELVGSVSGGGSTATAFATAVNVDLVTVTSTSGSVPTAPGLVSPASAALTNTTPTLTASFQDPDVGNTGTIRYELCADAACAGPRPEMQGTSASGLAIGASGTFTTPALTIGTTYWWRARGRDNSGNEGPWSAWRSFTVDGPPPAPAATNDGTGADVDWTNSTTQLSANWSTVAAGDLNRYEYCISATTNCGGTPVVGWTSTALVTTVTRTGLALTNGATYFVCVRAVDNQANVSTTSTCSDGITVDATVPVAPASVADGTGADITWNTSSTSVSANWPAGSDAASGVQNYDYCISTSSTGLDCASTATVSFTAVAGTSVTRTGLSLTNGVTYYVCVRTRDNAGNVSGVRCSNGQTVDTTVPTPPTVRNDGTGADSDLQASSSQLSANWSGATAGTSGIVGYDYCFSTSSTGADCAGAAAAPWTTQGGAAVTRAGLTLTSGSTYYVCVRTLDGAGRVSTSACSDGIVVDFVAPPVVSTLAAASPTLVAPALTWSTVTDATSGVAYYRVYRSAAATGPWTKISTDGAPTTGAYTDAAATFGTHFYTVQAVDAAGNEAAASNVVSVLYHRAPTTPTLISPANTVTGVALAPTLTASFSDADAHTGTVSFQVCADSACSSVVRSGSSASVASGTNGTWVVSAALASNTTYWWRAMATDTPGASSVWSGTWSFTTANLPSIIDNQSGDLTWRNTNSALYDVDFSDGVALASFATNVWSAAGQTGTQRQAWTQVAAISGTSYTTNWALLASTWTAMAEGVNYVSVRVTNSNALTTTNVDTFEVRKDTVAAPAVTTLATSTPTIIAPALTWTTVTDATSGVAYYRVYRAAAATGPWTKISTDGAPTTGSYADAAAAVNATHFYKVQAVDQAGNESVASNVISAYYHRAPNPPALVTPVNAATGVSPLPTLTAQHSDLDAHTGTIAFEVCSDSACSSVVRSGSSAAGIASGSNGSWTVPTNLAAGTQYWWRARSTDQHAAVGTWSVIWTFTTSTGPTITDNQTGDLTWRSTNNGAYDIDFSDPLGLDRFEVRVWSGAGQTGTMRQDWTLVAGSLAGTTYATNWALPASTWTALAEGVNYVSVRAYSDTAGVSTLIDAFEVRKDITAAAPGIVNDGTAPPDVDWWSSTSSLDMNWTASTGEAGLSGVLRYEYCISTLAACGGTVARTWTNAGAGTSVTAAGLALSNGTQYFVAMRMVDVAGNTSGAASSDAFRVDATAPTAPTLVTPAAAAVITSSPTLTATYNDPAPASPGQLSFEVCSNSTCSAVVQSGTSATGIAAGANGSWTPAVLAGGSYWWRAAGTDSAGTTGAWSTTRAFTLTYPPTTPTLVSPAAGAWVNTATPPLTATFQDPDTGATGQLSFELCLDAGCSSIDQTGTSAAGIATGSNGSWTPAAIPNGVTRYWRVRGNDGTSNGPWSATRIVRIDTAPPPAVTTLSSPSPTTTDPVLSWSTVVDAESGTAYYRVYRSTASGSLGSQINTDGATTTGSYTDASGLTAGTWYYTVRAVDAVGNEQVLGNSQVTVTYVAPLYLRSNAATHLSSGWRIELTPGSSANTATTPKIGQGAGYVQFEPGQAPASPVFVGALPAAPSGRGWIFEQAPGTSHVAGTWRFRMTTNASRNHTGFMNVRAWKVTAAAGSITSSTPLSGWVQGSTDVGATTVATPHFVDVVMPQVNFVAGEYLYVEYWENITVAASGGGSQNTTMTFQVDTTAERIEPTAPVPPGPSIVDNQTGDDTWRNTNTATYDVDFSDFTALASFSTNVWSGAAQTGTERQAWTQVAAIGGTSYTTNWSLAASTWSALAEGVNYVSVRVTNSGAQSANVVDAFYVRKDTVAAPAVSTLAAGTPTLSSPALTWTTVTDATSGVAYYRVYRAAAATGPWTQVSTDGAPTTGSYTDAAAAFGTHFYKVQAVDNAGNESAASNVVSVLYHRAPSTPTLISPANTATGTPLAPTLTASFSDADAHTGTVSFQVCSDAACTTPVRAGSSASVASGTNGTWVVSAALASNTTYWWRAMATDSIGATSAWTATWSFTTAALPSIIDNQSGDLTWRNTNSGLYNVDFSDGVALASFATNVWSGVGQTGTQRQAWTQVAAIGGTSYTTNWALLASTWTAMAEGVNYVSVRVTNSNALTTTNVDTFEVRKDTVAAPAVTTLATSTPTITAPALTWTTVTDATSGVAYYRVYRAAAATGPWTQASTDGAPVAGAFTDTGASVNATHFYKVQAVDQAGNEAAASNVVSAYYHRVPNAPALVTPSNAATGVTPLPTLTAQHSDLDAHTGTIAFEVCSDSACSSVVRSGSSAAGIASGSNGSWTVPTNLAAGTQYWWRARSTDQHAAVSTWSVIWTFTTSTGPTITDNQTGDLTWRNTNNGSYDIDFSDPLGLDRFEVRVWSGVGQTGTMRQDWTLVAGTLAGTSYTTNWALPASTWTALAEGVNYVSVRAYSDVAGVSTLIDAFEVRKDVTAAAPGIVNDGTAVDVDWWASTTSLDMNWTASTGEAGLSGVLRYEYCISTLAACGGTIARTWTNAGAGTSVTAAGLSLTNGTQYFVAMRMVDVATNTSVATSSDAFRVDATAPTAPTLVTPAAAAVLTASPTLTATYNDPAPASPGQLSFQVCSDATCSTVVDSGTSATGLASGANGNWTPAPLAGGSYWWRAAGTDSAATTGAWSTTRAFTLTYPPTTPTLVSPAAGAWVNTATPALTATFQDPDAGATGQLSFELCLDAGCSSIDQTGTSAAGIATGSNGSWTPAAIPNGATRYWRVRGNDGTSDGPWSATRIVRIDTAPPPAITTLAAPSPTSANPALTWTAVTDAESGTAYYRVYRSTAFGVLGSQVNVDGVTTTGAYTDTAAPGTGTYYYTVRAVDQVGNEQLVGNDQSAVVYTAPLYLRANAATNLTNAWTIETTAGTAANTVTKPKVGTGTGYVQFEPGLAPNAPVFVGALPASPTGLGWIYEQATGTGHVAGSWRFHVTTNASRNHTGFINVRAWKVTTDGAGAIQTSTPLSGWVQGTTDVGASTTDQNHFVDVAMPQVTFAAGEHLYVEYWENITVAASGGGSQNTTVTFQVDTSAERIEPTGPIPPMNVTSATPASLAQGRRDTIVRITGTGFVSGATVAFSGAGISLDSTTWVSATAIDVQLDVAAAATLGARNVTVTNPDTSNATGIGIFEVTAPSMSIAFSTLGYTDAARDTVAPHAIDFGPLVVGASKQIGPATSGQTLAGTAIRASITSDTDTILQASSTDWTAGAQTMPAGALAHRAYGTSGAWVPYATTNTTVEGPLAPGATTIDHDLQLTVPPAQAAGAYSATLTYTLVAAP